MLSGGYRIAKRITFICIALLFVPTGVAFSQAGWKAIEDKGFSFKHPSDWLIVDLGGADYGGTQGYLKALSPPSEANFAIVILTYPKFSIDLKSLNMTYKEYMKSFFEDFLKEGKFEDNKIEEIDGRLQKGEVPGFMVMEEKSEESVRAAMICGDLVKGNAAILLVTMNLPADEPETGKLYLDQAEQIMASFAFPE
ncbi:MAG: hypothetical protein JXD23_17085 [Spirochaetales bacterium]|nr:hypothetical protein [Spirochaetales bacterium]